MRTPDRGSERIADIREEMQSTMEDSAGIFRSGDSLSKGVDQLAELQQRLRASSSTTKPRCSTQSWSLRLSWPTCSISLKPSCSPPCNARSHGAPISAPTSPRDDTRFLNHALAYRDADGAVRIERSPVTITRWPPGERVYGR